MSSTASIHFNHRVPASHPLSIERAYHRHRDQAYVSSMFALFALVGDLLCVVGALITGFWLRFFSEILPVIGGYPSFVEGLSAYRGLIIFGALVMFGLLFSTQAYVLSALTRFGQASHAVWQSVLIWAGAFLALALILRLGPGVSRMFVIFSALIALFLLLGWRYLLAMLIRHSAAAQILGHRILIVGWNEQTNRLYSAFQSGPTGHYQVLGCVPSAKGEFDSPPPTDVRHFTAFDQLEDLIRDLGIDLVIGAEIDTTKEGFGHIAAVCERQMINFKAIPSNFRIMLTGLGTNFIGGVPLLGFEKLPLDNPLNRVVKRGFDVVVGSVGLLLSLPIIGIFALLVYRESPGPVFYRQVRTGRHGRRFEIIKIRSMKMDAEAPGTTGWTTEDDPRRLKVGALMRKLNIDELPQFWNVLHGEMSIVGPRPERPELIERFKSDIPHYNARHYVKPGITGWAQVNGWRGNTDLTQRILYDLHYMENWSLLFDISIIFRTFRAGENAY